MVLGFGLFLGLGAVSLWTLVPSQPLGLVLGAGHGLGTVLGKLEIHERLLRLGAFAAVGVLSAGLGIHLLRALGRIQFQLWIELTALRVCSNPEFL